MLRAVKSHRFFCALHQCTVRGLATAVGSPTTVTVSDCGRFTTLTLSRPDKHNALSPDTMEAIKQATSDLAKQPEIRALFLKAEGRSFCAGGDLKHMRATADFTKEQNVEDAMKMSGVFDALYRFPRPVIAMVEGNTFGGGLGLISACDMAFGLQGLKFSFSEIKLGVIPATISPYVIEKIGITAARRYFLTAEQFDSVAAEKIGLLNEIVATSDDLLAIEEKLKLDFSATSTYATHATKELISELASRSVDLATREWTAGKLAEVRDSVDGREGMSSFLEKRKPRWVVSP